VTSTPGSERPIAVDPADQAQAYIRKIGLGLLIASMVLDVVWSQMQNSRMQWAAVQYRLKRRIDPPGPILTEVAISLLESSSTPRPKPGT
jgi:hypothetical protein